MFCWKNVAAGTEEADISFRNVALFLRAWKEMSGRDLERFVDKPRWFEFRVVGGFEAQVLPLMLDSMGIQVSKDAWMQILPEAAEDSIVLVTAQCEQIEPNIVQLRREQKRRRYWQERCKKRDAMVRKLRDELSESQLRDSCKKWFRPSGGISLALKRTVGGVAACKMGLATCQDVSVQTVLAWEHKLAASLLAQSREVEPVFFFWYRGSGQSLGIVQTPRTRGFGQMRNCMSAKFRRRVCQILRANTGNPRMCRCWSRIKRYADMQVVCASGQSGQFQLNMLKKQFGSVGAPTWSQLATVCNDLFDTVTEKSTTGRGEPRAAQSFTHFCFHCHN